MFVGGEVRRVIAKGSRIFIGFNRKGKFEIAVLDPGKKSFFSLKLHPSPEPSEDFIAAEGGFLILTRTSRLLLYTEDGNLISSQRLNLGIFPTALLCSENSNTILTGFRPANKGRELYQEVWLVDQKGVGKRLLSIKLPTSRLPGRGFTVSLSEPALAASSSAIYMVRTTFYAVEKLLLLSGKTIRTKLKGDSPDFSPLEKKLRGKLLHGKRPFAACKIFPWKGSLWILTNFWSRGRRRIDLLDEALRLKGSWLTELDCPKTWFSEGKFATADGRGNVYIYELNFSQPVSSKKDTPTK